ncbi:MAG TPA: zinc ribbon domain-containing protein [Pyrinomonadaceae bacterium]|jgi:hypothetical protein
MVNNLCAKCGAELLAGARFCRRCGQSSTFDGASVTEAETRVFNDTVERRAPETQYYDQRPTGPGYLSPDETRTAAAAESDASSSRKRNMLIMGSVIILVAIIALTILAAIKLTSNPVPTTPIVTKPEIPAPPTVPQPPQPPQPPAAETGKANALDYPGAEVTMEMTHGGEGSMRQLHTSDSFEKVVAWYTDKLKPSEIIKTPEGPTAVLKSKQATAIINSDEEGTQILLKKGIDQ